MLESHYTCAFKDCTTRIPRDSRYMHLQSAPSTSMHKMWQSIRAVFIDNKGAFVRCVPEKVGE